MLKIKILHVHNILSIIQLIYYDENLFMISNFLFIKVTDINNIFILLKLKQSSLIILDEHFI